jgi:hypothetical protein
VKDISMPKQQKLKGRRRTSQQHPQRLSQKIVLMAEGWKVARKMKMPPS